VFQHPARPQRSPYDDFMLRFHDFLKANDDFQERGRKVLPDLRAGLGVGVFSPTLAATRVLRGRFALEHSYFVAPEALALPDEAPAAAAREGRAACRCLRPAA